MNKYIEFAENEWSISLGGRENEKVDKLAKSIANDKLIETSLKYSILIPTRTLL